MSTTSEAYILVTIPNATLSSSSSGTITGQLALEYVTFDLPPTAAVTQDVLLVLVLRTGNVVVFEAPLDPTRALTVSSAQPSSSRSGGGGGGSARRRYVFHATRDDTEFTVELPLPPVEQPNADDIELFHSVLVGYVTDLRVDGELQLQLQSSPAPPARVVEGVAAAEEDLRGRFVLMNEGDGEIVGTLDGSVRVREDPSLVEKGHERDPVVVELPDGADTLDDGLLDEEVLVRTIPPEDRDWMLKGAVFVSHAISGTTTLLTSAMATASNLYIAHSTPSTATASNSTTAATTPKSSNTPSSSSSPPPPPSRTLLILQSPTTRKHLDRIHTVSGGAVKLSNKATAAVESLIDRTIGGGSSSSSANRGKGRAVPSPQPTGASDTTKHPTPSLPPRSRGPSPTPPDTKPALPSRHATSSRGQSPLPAPAPQPLRTRTSLALSASLILSALEASSVRLVEAGGAAVTAAVSHKYGTTAGENAALAASTARNIVLVYVDVRGLRRRVVVKRVAKTWARGHVARTREEDAAARRK
jgi:spartin